jgi:hypothetical protein
MNWIDLAQDGDQWRAPVNMVSNLRGPLNVGKYLNSGATGNFLRRTQMHGVSGCVCCLKVCHLKCEDVINSLPT